MMSLARIQQRMRELDNWGLEGSGIIVKEMQFTNFREAILFVTKVAEIAELHNHHPTIMIDYTSVRLTLTTHDERGLSDKDFDVAAAIDKIGK